jgi:molecular chaperone GrpE
MALPDDMSDPKPETSPEHAGNGAGDPREAQYQARIAELEAKVAENWDKALRATAELENVRRRVERESATAAKYALERVLGELIAVNDSLELALKAVAGESEETRKHLEGVALTHKQFWTTLERYGVTQIDPQGQPFNPEFHEAVQMLASAEVPPNHVMAVMQKGYKLHERLLRPAMVVVAKAP